MSGNNVFAIAYKYHTLGRCVIPSGGGDKHKKALISWTPYQTTKPDDAQLEKWQRELNPKVWAMVTGPVSGLFVTDCDSATAIAMMEAAGLKPHIRTPRGGCHYYCKWPSWVIPTKAGLLPGVDIRGQGGYVNFCGENEKTTYQVLILPTDDSLCTFEQLPAELQQALRTQTAPKQPTVTPVAEIIPQGQRNDALTRLAGSMRHKGLSSDAIYAALSTVNREQCEPPLPDNEVRQISESVGRYIPGQAVTNTSFNLTDLGNAERLVKGYGAVIRYCYERRMWLIWNGKVWEWDAGAKIKSLAKLTVRAIYHEAGNEPDEKTRKTIADHGRRSESDHRINAMISLAQSESGIPVKVTELDRNYWLFNCLNGTLDLRTGQLLPHRKEDLLTIIVPLEYYSNAQCTLWPSFLDRVTGGNTELQDYLQRAVGYSLTGNTKSQVLFFLYGLGNNGKSTFVITIRKLVGEYGERVNTDLFMLKDKNAGGPKEGLANLKGKRYVVASELEDGRRLAVSLIKDMTGGETIKADRKYEHEIEYEPTHKLWIVGNHKPVITDTTLSIWRRVKLIPFTVTIPDREIDPDLPSKLEAELLGILAWAVKGCLDWQRYGLREPDVVTNATATYRHEQDILGDFIEDCCILEPLASMPKAELKDEYQKWCQDNSGEPVSQRTFRVRLIEKGITESKSGSIRYWKGITLKSLVPNGLENVPMSQNNDIPDYPTHPCHNCGCGDYWLREASQWGKAEWLCSRCHSKPEGGN